MRKFLLAFTSLTLLSTGVLADGGMDDAREEAERRAERESSSSSWTRNPFSFHSFEAYVAALRRAGDRRISSGMNRSFDTNSNRGMQQREARSGNTRGMTGGDAYYFAPMPPMPRWEPPQIGYRFDRLYPDTPRWDF